MFSNKKVNRIFIFISLIFLSGLGYRYFFKKKPIDTSTVPITETKKDSIVYTTLLSEFFDLQNYNGPGTSSEKASSGKFSQKLSPDLEFGFGVVKSIQTIPSGEGIKNIDLTVQCYTQKDISDALYVLTIDDTTGKNIYWEGKPIVCQEGNWSTLHFSYDLKPEFIKPEYIIKLYPWNRSRKEEFFIDDISVHYNGMIAVTAPDRSKNSNTNFFFDFETTDGINGTDNIKATTAHSGKMACLLSGGIEYGPSIIKKVNEVSSVPFKKIALSAWVYPLTDKPVTVLTASIVNDKKETVFWGGKSTEKQPFPKNAWTKINASYDLPFEKIGSEDVIQVNIWNQGKTDVIVDDLEIVYGAQPERRGLSSTNDPNLFYEKHFVPQKNKPPFQTIYFEKQEINNENSTFITPDKKNDLTDFSPNDEFLAGNFIADKNNLDEIICIKKMRSGLFSYSPGNKQFQIAWESTNAGDPIWNDNNQAYSGDFNNDGKCDVLMLNKKNSTWTIIDFDGKNWNVLTKGNEKELNKSWIKKNPVPSAEIFKPSDILLPGDYIGDAKEELLKLNFDWRYDLKVIEQDKDDYTILGTIDFKGYPNDYNPKYYEFVKIVPGKFINPTRSSLLIMMRNCADEGFNGIHCDRFENVTYLPNSTQIYTIDK
jgi:hypothetical protein